MDLRKHHKYIEKEMKHQTHKSITSVEEAVGMHKHIKARRGRVRARQRHEGGLN
jgi:hypothetical protein